MLILRMNLHIIFANLRIYAYISALLFLQVEDSPVSWVDVEDDSPGPVDERAAVDRLGSGAGSRHLHFVFKGGLG